jgi:hypothetical protein
MIVEPCLARPLDCWRVKAGLRKPEKIVRLVSKIYVCDEHGIPDTECIHVWAVRAFKNNNVSEKYGS